jgi:NAD(P)-dependent dehydrogenase (short-subunit alcohol dehydrogenase family)
MARTIALDYAKNGIRANCILPGAFPGTTHNHPITLSRLEQQRQWPTGPAANVGRTLLGMGEGIDIGAAAVYLAGPSASFISGQMLVLDGGFLVSVNCVRD